jgi:ubiquinone/menaquinone biosynthesis C-methylase UbiE
MKKWMDAVAVRFPEHRPLSILDIGSGTGRFSIPMAHTFGGPIYGIEPSSKMRKIAASASAPLNVSYLEGTMEHLPLPSNSCDAGFASYAWHHVTDKDLACSESRRVIKPGGRLLLRTNFADRYPDLWWYKYFPRAREVDVAMYEPLRKVVERFYLHGWSQVALDQVTFVAAESPRQDFERLQQRALSLFEFLTSDEIDEGFAQIARALPSEQDGPVVHSGDLLTLERVGEHG